MKDTRPAPQDTRASKFRRPAAGLATALTLVFSMTGFAALPADEVHDTTPVAVEEDAELGDENASAAATSESTPPAAGPTAPPTPAQPEPPDTAADEAGEPADDTTASGDEAADTTGADAAADDSSSAQDADIASTEAGGVETGGIEDGGGEDAGTGSGAAGDPDPTEDAAASGDAAAGEPAAEEEAAADSGSTEAAGEAPAPARLASAPALQAVDTSAYNPYVHVGASVSEWDVARTGIELFAGGFAGDSAVVVLVDGAPAAEFRTDEHGFAEYVLVAELAPGSHTLVLTADEGTTPERTFTVVEDDEYYDPVSPQVSASSWTVTVTELEDTPITIRGTGFPINAPVDLLINDARQEALTTDSSGQVELEVMAPLAPGEYTVMLRHPAGSASVTFHVVPDEPGDAAPAGSYAGQSLQDRAGGLPWDDATASPVQFRVGDDGRLSGFQTEFWWVCAVGGYHGSDYDTFDGMPPTLITVGRPFEISWADDAMTYVLTGVVNADGSASGHGVAHQGVCGAHAFAWSAQLDGDLPGPVDPTPAPPAQIPADTPAAGDLSDATRGAITVPATVSPGATVPVVIGTGYAGDRVGVWLFSEPTHLVTAAVSADGTVHASLPADAAGEHRIAVYAADGSLIGWDVITIAADDTGDSGAGDGSGTDDESGAADDVERSTDRTSRAAERTGVAEASTDRLPETGVSLMPVALVALTALLAGVALVRRYSARS